MYSKLSYKLVIIQVSYHTFTDFHKLHKNWLKIYGKIKTDLHTDRLIEH